MLTNVSPTDRAFAKLCGVVAVAFDARTDAATGWAGTGAGTIAVERVAGDTITFRERGTFTPAVGRPMAFTNVYRWTTSPGRLHLSHLRFGPDRPVILFDLVADGADALVSADPHACGDDRYAARLTWDGPAVFLTWTVTGPAKAERIAYVYRPA